MRIREPARTFVDAKSSLIIAAVFPQLSNYPSNSGVSPEDSLYCLMQTVMQTLRFHGEPNDATKNKIVLLDEAVGPEYKNRVGPECNGVGAPPSYFKNAPEAALEEQASLANEGLFSDELDTFVLYNLTLCEWRFRASESAAQIAQIVSLDATVAESLKLFAREQHAATGPSVCALLTVQLFRIKKDKKRERYLVNKNLSIIWPGFANEATQCGSRRRARRRFRCSPVYLRPTNFPTWLSVLHRRREQAAKEPGLFSRTILCISSVVLVHDTPP